MASLVGKRLARIARRGSLSAVVRAARREVWLRTERAHLRELLASEAPIVVGPFLGEVGFEVLYWRPFVRHLLRAHGVDRARVTVVTRGGAGIWYRDVAARSAEVLDGVSPDELRDGIEQRSVRSGQRKQVDVDGFDRLVLDRLGLGGQPLLHPLHLYWDQRYLWEGLRPPEQARAEGDYDPLERDPSSLDGVTLPPRFVAVKLYANDTLSSDPATIDTVRSAIRTLGEKTSLVLLETGVVFDDHVGLDVAGPNVTSVAHALAPRSNLAQQAEIVARADALLSTYGGFSYVGPFLGVPTVAVAETPEWNEMHERVLRAVLPNAAYRRTSPGGIVPAVEALL